jgi:hypothetical protein
MGGIRAALAASRIRGDELQDNLQPSQHSPIAVITPEQRRLRPQIEQAPAPDGAHALCM